MGFCLHSGKCTEGGVHNQLKAYFPMSKLLTYALFIASVIVSKLLQNDTHDSCRFLPCNVIICCWWLKDTGEWQTLMNSTCHK